MTELLDEPTFVVIMFNLASKKAEKINQFDKQTSIHHKVDDYYILLKQIETIMITFDCAIIGVLIN